MKRIQFISLLLIIATLSFCSCSDDNTELKIQMAQLQQALQTVQSDLNQLKNTKLETLNVTALEQKITNLQAELTKLQGNTSSSLDLSTLENEIKELKAKLQTLETTGTTSDDNLTIQQQITNLQAELARLKDAQADAGDLSGLEVKINELNSKLTTLEAAMPDGVDLTTITNQLADIQKQLNIFKATNGHDYVDLGLSVWWATCNVGALSPEAYGYYYAWGETSPKETYTWDSYFDTKDGGQSFTKYNLNGGKTELDPEDDAASQNWGGKWRTPTLEQLQELYEKCTSKWITQNGVNGRKFTSKANGNSIFLPAAGPIDSGSQGWYWSRVLTTDYNNNASTFGFDASDRIVWLFGDRYARAGGRSIRPVCTPPSK